MTTGSAEVSSTGATLSGSFSGATGAISETGFYYGTSSGNLGTKVSAVSTSSPFSKEITGLTEGTTYYYKAYVKEYNESTSSPEERYGSEKSFTVPLSHVPTGWLELPATTSGSDYYRGIFKVGSARNYTYLYQYSTYTSLWTAYPLYSGVMSSSKSTKGTTWAKNPVIDESKQVNVWDASYNVIYGQTNYVENASTASEYYARGHQIPNADRSNVSDMQSQTYYATNSTPQLQNKFNSKIWGTLEGDVRSIASATDTVYVVTGAAFHKGNGNEDITYIHPKGDPGKSVPVPNYYWKVLLKVKWSGSGNNKSISEAKAIGVWLPHEQFDKTDYSTYVTSVDQIETWTGFDFFANLPDDLEATAETNSRWDIFSSF